MRCTSRSTFLALLFGLTVFVSSARAEVLTVGPSGQFAEISEALEAAQPGDAILVAPGTYGAIHITKPVRVLADGPVPPTIFAAQGSAVRLSNISSSKDTVVSGFTVYSNGPSPADEPVVRVASCPGTVVLHDIEVQSGAPQVLLGSFGNQRLVLERCTLRVGGASSDTLPSAALRASGTPQLWIVDSTITGGPKGPGVGLQGNHALDLTGTFARVWRSTLLGGNAVAGGPGTPNGGHAVLAYASGLACYGGTVGVVRGGNGAFGSGPGLGGSALVLGDSTTAVIQEAVPFTGGLDGTGLATASPHIVAGTFTNFVITDFVYPTLSAPEPQVPVGGAIALPADGHAGGTVVLLASTQSRPPLVLLDVKGLSFIDPVSAVLVGTTVLDGSGAGAFGLGLPPLPGLAGITLMFQGVQLSPQGVAFTNPALSIIVP